MAFEVNASNNVADEVKATVAQPKPAKMNPFEQELSEDEEFNNDVRESMPESVIIPRESTFGPPPLPPKDTRSSVQSDELSAQQARDSMKRQSKESDDHQPKESQEPQAPQSTLNSMLERQNSTASGEIRIHFTPSTLEPFSAEKTLVNTMSTLHPLAMSPPSPMLLLPKMPQRPARPSSLRLSAFTRKRDLTTSRVVVLNTEKTETTGSYQTQPHTAYSAGGSGRTKYGRGKHAATELIPQPSDDPQDPLVRKSRVLGHSQSHH